jgi:hypothetical protein
LICAARQPPAGGAMRRRNDPTGLGGQACARPVREPPGQHGERGDAAATPTRAYLASRRQRAARAPPLVAASIGRCACRSAFGPSSPQMALAALVRHRCAPPSDGLSGVGSPEGRRCGAGQALCRARTDKARITPTSCHGCRRTGEPPRQSAASPSASCRTSAAAGRRPGRPLFRSVYPGHLANSK